MREAEGICRFYGLEKDVGEGSYVVLRMYDVSGILLNGVKSMYVDSLACVRAKWERASVSGLIGV